MQLGNLANPKHALGGSSPSRRKRIAGLRLRIGLVTFALTVLPAVISARAALEPTTPLANDGRQGWATENGLPQNTVQALAQTQDGFIWLGTEVGLVRFDGSSFV